MRKIRSFVLPLVFVLFAGVIVYWTLNLRQFSCTVCVEFQGREACRTASGATKEDALRVATDNACAQVASGMSATRICSQKEPISVDCGDGEL